MEGTDVSPVLRERLGPDASLELLALLEDFCVAWSSHVTNQTLERFERQLTHQIGGFRDDLREGEASLHTEMRVLETSLRAELSAVRDEVREGHVSLRLEMRDIGATIVRETTTLGSTLRREMAEQRVELLKWSFAFWFGQIVALGGLMTVLFRRFLP